MAETDIAPLSKESAAARDTNKYTVVVDGVIRRRGFTRIMALAYRERAAHFSQDVEILVEWPRES